MIEHIIEYLKFIPINKDRNKSNRLTDAKLHNYGFFDMLMDQFHTLIGDPLKLRILHSHFDR